jgi:hypothetical protein
VKSIKHDTKILNVIKYTWHAHKAHYSVSSVTDNLICKDLSLLQHNAKLTGKISLTVVYMHFQQIQLPAIFLNLLLLLSTFTTQRNLFCVDAFT